MGLKQNFIVNSHSVTAKLTFATEVSVERRLCFAVEVMTASGNWKHLLPLIIIFSASLQCLEM